MNYLDLQRRKEEEGTRKEEEGRRRKKNNSTTYQFPITNSPLPIPHYPFSTDS
ncbi:hypothetical protein [Microcoleus asticus]|uniref:hypothetical protein n=1 Tax=Microcoleus asticus TaxID=2815231 RepID=UPI00155560DB|nr:hypothetical protein [Microcoleus asticus]